MNRPPDHPVDVDAIVSHREGGEAFDQAPGRLVGAADFTPETRFHRAAVHDAVAGTTSIFVAVGGVVIGCMSILLGTPHAEIIVTVGMGSATIITLATLGQPPFRSNITLKVDRTLEE